jgi:membrane protein implicated in regulation of membrane protease activity
MRWFKVAAFVVGVLIAFLVVSSVLGFLVEVAIAALVVAAVVLAVKVAFYRRQVSWKGSGRQVRGPRYGSPLPRHNMSDADDELTRLKREMGG